MRFTTRRPAAMRRHLQQKSHLLWCGMSTQALGSRTPERMQEKEMKECPYL